jgi:hypothetical protein
MGSGNTPGERLIAWNGLQISPPRGWEGRVAGLYHLVFEENFQPRLQIRWQKKTNVTAASLDRLAKKLAGPNSSMLPARELPSEWQLLGEKFLLRILPDRAPGAVAQGLCYCQESQTLIHFQVFFGTEWSCRQAAICLATFSCHRDQETTWRMDDFSLVTPSSFALTSYTFAAGLTRLSFVDGDLGLQTCKLAPADTRLKQQTLGQILKTLSGANDLNIRPDPTNNTLEGFRSPGLLGRMRFRLGRTKPYILAHIRHDQAKNRVLAMILSANRPLAGSLLPTLSSRYEII